MNDINRNTLNILILFLLCRLNTIYIYSPCWELLHASANAKGYS